MRKSRPSGPSERARASWRRTTWRRRRLRRLPGEVRGTRPRRGSARAPSPRGASPRSRRGGRGASRTSGRDTRERREGGPGNGNATRNGNARGGSPTRIRGGPSSRGDSPRGARGSRAPTSPTRPPRRRCSRGRAVRVSGDAWGSGGGGGVGVVRGRVVPGGEGRGARAEDGRKRTTTPNERFSAGTRACVRRGERGLSVPGAERGAPGSAARGRPRSSPRARGSRRNPARGTGGGGREDR